MANSLIGGLLLNAAIVALILASIVEVIVDVREMDAPRFLPHRLADLPPSEPATALGAAGVGLLVVGLVAEMAVNPLPGGHLFVGLIAIVAFLFSGGFVVNEA
ncbi:hypothetical protein [Halorientalis halophila]|uniref:hypothetical protein n=1 Tax=Halorientalis halophila TaxID=3108499 RepID=UPI0030088551